MREKIEDLILYYIRQIRKTLAIVLFNYYKRKLRKSLSPFTRYIENNLLDNEPYFLESIHEQKYIKGTIIVSEIFFPKIVSTINNIISEIPKTSNVDSFEEKEKVIELVSILNFKADIDTRYEIDLFSFETEGKVATSNEIEVFCHFTVVEFIKVAHEYGIHKSEINYIIIKIFY